MGGASEIKGSRTVTKTYTLWDNQADVFSVAAETENTSISGLGGNDNITGGLGSDTLNGGNGNDTLYGGSNGADLILGGAGNDYLIATSSMNGGSSTLKGGTDNDTYVMGTGQYVSVVEAAGEGIDTIRLGMRANDGWTMPENVENLVITDVGANLHDDDLDLWIFYVPEYVPPGSIQGNSLGNLMIGFNGAANSMRGNGGNDTIYGGSMADWLTGGDGHDKLIGGAGNDRLIGDRTDDTAPGGNDTLDGGVGADKMEGGKGNDLYYVDNAGDQVVEKVGEGTDLVIATVSHTLAANVENLTLQGLTGMVGGGNALANTIVGGLGNDSLYGMDGNDKVYASVGNDLVGGSNGNDLLRGESGNDTLYGDANNDTLDGGTGSDYLDGGIGNDSLIGGADNDLLSGGTGDDVMDGGDGYDTLQGGAGTDTLTGGAGNDWLQGGAGLDHIFGGAGADRFRFTAVSDSPVGQALDGVWDFQKGVDVIDLQMIDANVTGSALGNQSFAFSAAMPMFIGAGDLWLEEANGNTTVKADVNGDGGADFGIFIFGVTGMTAADFML